MKASAASIWRSFSAVMRSPYWNREDRHANEGLSQVGNPSAREIADLLLGQAGLDHRGADAALPGRLHARPVVAEVVHVRAVHEGPARLPLRDRRQVREQ